MITSLDEGAGDKTERVATIGGVGSARLHLQPLFHAATELDLHPRVISLDVDRPSILSELGQPEICFIGKINHFDDNRVKGYAMATLAAVARLKAKKVKIALLYCDHLAILPCVRGLLYKDLLALADQVIVPCQAMADRALPFISRSTQVSLIEDPWQVRLQSYKPLDRQFPLRLGWFGNSNNIIFLCEQLSDLMSSVTVPKSVELVVLSSEFALENAKTAFLKSLPSAIRPWKLNLVRWKDSLQPQQLEQVLGSVHVVWIPSNSKSSIKGGVSHNRLVDAVRSGCVVVGSPMQSYKELNQLALLGFNHGDLLNRLIPQYERLTLKYDSLRSKLLSRFSPNFNNVRWKQLLAENVKNK